MTILYLIFLLSAIYFSIRWDGLQEEDSHKDHRFWLLCLMLVCIAGFSYGLGGDKFTYMDQFEAIPEDTSILEYITLAIVIQGNMPLWTLLSMLAKRTFDSFYALQLFQAAFTIITFCYIASKYTQRKFIFLIAYFLSLTFFIFNAEVMREGIAVALSMLGMEAYMNKNKKNFFVYYALAVCFHISALIVIAFPFIRLKISPKTLLIAVVVAFCVWFVSDLLISKVVMSVLGATGALASKIVQYSTVASNIFGFIGSAVRYMILPFIVMYYSYIWEEDEELKQKKEKLISFHLVIAICACALAGFTRFRNYMEIYYLIMLSDFVYTLFRTKERFLLRLGTMVMTVFLLVWQQYLLYYPENNVYFYQRYVPYRCILDENEDVHFRREVHLESVKNTVTDEGTRDIK